MKLKTVYFTIIELLIVITILMILISLIQPTLRKITKTADRAVCLNSKKSFSIGAFVFAEDNDSELPNFNSSHIHHARTEAIDLLEPYLNNRDDVECPNFQLQHHRTKRGNVNLGLVYLAHKKSNRYPSLLSSSNESIWGPRWFSATRTIDNPEWTLSACRVEDSERTWTGKFPHTKDEENWKHYPVGLTIDQAKWEGASAGYLDGSASWIHREDQQWHLTSRYTGTKFYFPSMK